MMKRNYSGQRFCQILIPKTHCRRTKHARKSGHEREETSVAPVPNLKVAKSAREKTKERIFKRQRKPKKKGQSKKEWAAGKVENKERKETEKNTPFSKKRIRGLLRLLPVATHWKEGRGTGNTRAVYGVEPT